MFEPKYALVREAGWLGDRALCEYPSHLAYHLIPRPPEVCGGSARWACKGPKIRPEPPETVPWFVCDKHLAEMTGPAVDEDYNV